MNQYPTYFKCVDPDGHTVALICRSQENKIIVLQPVATSDRVGYDINIRQVSSEEELKSQIGGQVVHVPAQEYNDTLFTTWGFEGSDVYRASDDLTGEDENTEPKKEATNADDTNEISAPVEQPIVESNGQPEQSIDAGSEGLGSVSNGNGDDTADAVPGVDDGNGIAEVENEKLVGDAGDNSEGDVAASTEPVPDADANPGDNVPTGTTDDAQAA